MSNRQLEGVSQTVRTSLCNFLEDNCVISSEDGIFSHYAAAAEGSSTLPKIKTNKPTIAQMLDALRHSCFTSSVVMVKTIIGVIRRRFHRSTESSLPFCSSVRPFATERGRLLPAVCLGLVCAGVRSPPDCHQNYSVATHHYRRSLFQQRPATAARGNNNQALVERKAPGT